MIRTHQLSGHLNDQDNVNIVHLLPPSPPPPPLSLLDIYSLQKKCHVLIVLVQEVRIDWIKVD